MWRKQGSFDWQGKDRRSICSKLQINWQPSFIFCTVPLKHFQRGSYFFIFKFRHWKENRNNRLMKNDLYHFLCQNTMYIRFRWVVDFLARGTRLAQFCRKNEFIKKVFCILLENKEHLNSKLSKMSLKEVVYIIINNMK